MMMHTMRTPLSPLRNALMFAVLGATCTAFLPVAFAQMGALPATSQTSTAPGVLDRQQAGAILPPSVFYAGQSAPVQARNSAGIRFPSGKLAIMAMVDTSGYSSAVQQTYQAYLITEVPLQIGDKTLSPGAYGFGFVHNNRMVVMDIGGHELLHATTTRDEQFRRPTPLQIVRDTAEPGHFRLYLGRSYITISAAAHG